MSWNNRIFRHEQTWKGEKQEWFTINEAFYDKKGNVTSWTEEDIKPYGETVDELIGHLEQMLNDAKRGKDDVLDYDAASPIESKR